MNLVPETDPSSGGRHPAGVASLEWDAIRLVFQGARSVAPAGLRELPHKTHFFLGNDPAKWVTNVRSFSAIAYPNLYDGVDLIYRVQNDGALKYEFRLAPGVDPGAIRLSVEGSEEIRVDPRGNLVVATAHGVLVDSAPYAYQDIGGSRIQVPCGFRVAGRQYGFQCGGHDRNHALVIDPVVYATFLGGLNGDLLLGLAVDSSGSAYAVGQTIALDFPTTPGAFDSTYGGLGDAFVTKISPDGSSLVYSTYLGGSLGDIALAIAVDDSGSAYVTGWTASDDFPTTVGANDTTSNGFDDGFVAKIAPDGSALVYSTYLGGSDTDFSMGIGLDGSGAAYVAGDTFSSDFPVTPGANDTSWNGAMDAFAAKLSADGSTLAYATYLGGTSGDFAEGGVAVDAAGVAYLAGRTFSADFPTTSGAYNTAHSGGTFDAFVLALTADGSALVYATYLGGGAEDRAFGIDVDGSGSAYVTGETDSSNFPTTVGASDATYNGGLDAFVAKVSPDGSFLEYSSYLGGAGTDQGRGIAVDARFVAHVVGRTSSGEATFPTTPGASDPTYNGGLDAFVAKVSPDGSSFLYVTYLGGTAGDRGNGIATDADGNAYVGGSTQGSGFPVTPGANDTTFGPPSDGFLAKLIPDAAPPTSTAQPLPPYQTATTFDVAFTASDDPFGSGLARAELWYRFNGGAWILVGSTTDFATPFPFVAADGDGTYGFFTLAVDLAGNAEAMKGASEASTIVDTVAPSSAADALPPYTNQTAFAVNATAADATSGVAQVELLYRKDSGTWTPYGVDTVPPWSYGIDAALTGGDGAYDFRTIATDNAGNVESKAPVAEAGTVVETVPPGLAITDPPEGAVVNASPITVSGGASDDTAVDRVEVRVNGGPWMPAVGTTAWSFPALSLTPGPNVIEARSWDVAGNPSATASANVTYDNVPPTVRIVDPIDGSTFDVDTVTVSGTASDDTAVDLVEIRVNGGPWTAVSGTVAWTAVVTLNPGSNAVEVRAWDVAGNPSPPDSLNVVYDRRPSASLAAPTAGEVLAGGIPFRFEWTMDDAEDPATTLRVTLRVFDGTSWNEVLLNETGRTSATWTPPTVLTSEAQAILEVYDSRGGLGSAAESFAIADLTAPVVTALDVDPASVVVGQDVQITCAATDDYPGPLSYGITVWQGGVAVADFDAAQVVFRTSEAGTHTSECVATDGSGNPSSAGSRDFAVTEPSEPFPWWILLVLGTIATVTIVAIAWSRRRRRRGTEEAEDLTEAPRNRKPG